MNWMLATLVSAVFLGCYDLCIKHSVRENAVLPVLFLSNTCSAAVWLALLALQSIHPGILPASMNVPSLSWVQHGQLIFKSLIVSASWICSYFGVKHLPVSIASPIRATGPLWTFLGALAILTERPTLVELLGMAITLGAFFLLSLAGKGEGVHFHRDKWVGWLMAGTILAGLSGVYDKFLLGRCGLTASTVQAWFTIYMAVLFLPMAAGWKRRWWARNEFQWRWSIPLLSASLLVADFLYFSALHDPGALVSLVSSIRRGGTLVAFAGGVLLFGEKGSRHKLLAVLGILAGIVLTLVG
jgi:bacterial/archaeal transporter family protein